MKDYRRVASEICSCKVIAIRARRQRAIELLAQELILACSYKWPRSTVKGIVGNNTARNDGCLYGPELFKCNSAEHENIHTSTAR
jgi:hypothetical protein